MTTQNVPEISLDELTITLESYAGPAQPRRLPVRRRRRPWRFAWAAAALVLVSVAAAYAAGFNPFPGISAADHPATSNDTLPASLTAHIAEFSSGMERYGHGRLLPDTARFITQVPSGMRFYTIATSAGVSSRTVQAIGRATVSAKRSGALKATVFGSTSANTTISRVITTLE